MELFKTPRNCAHGWTSSVLKCENSQKRLLPYLHLYYKKFSTLAQRNKPGDQFFLNHLSFQGIHDTISETKKNEVIDYEYLQIKSCECQAHRHQNWNKFPHEAGRYGSLPAI